MCNDRGVSSMRHCRRRNLHVLALAASSCILGAGRTITAFVPTTGITKRSGPGYFLSSTKVSRREVGLSVVPVAEAFVGSDLATSHSVASSLLDAFRSETDPFKYAFMLPIATLVATSCQLAGIGGAALFSPLFLLVFPLLGPEYPLPSAAAAIASALLTECFGFASGLAGFSRRGLVDWSVAGQFVTTSVPFALLGAVLAKYVAGDPFALRAVYAALMLGLAAFLTFSPRPDEIEAAAAEGECDIPELDERELQGKPGAEKELLGLRTTTGADGTEYTYLAPRRGSAKSLGATATGASLTGLLGVGIGEVVLPQLVRGCCMPLPVAAGTSVAIVVLTALCAACVQFLSLAAGLEGSAGLADGLISVVPWSLVQFTIPGVLLGGQIAPFLASKRWFSDEDIETFAATLFGIVGVAFAAKALTG